MVRKIETKKVNSQPWYRDRILKIGIIIQDSLAILLTIISILKKEPTAYLLIIATISIILIQFMIYIITKIFEKSERKKKMNTEKTLDKSKIKQLKAYTTKNGTTIYAKSVYKKSPKAGYYALIRRDPNRISLPMKEINQPLGMSHILLVPTHKQLQTYRDAAEKMLEKSVIAFAEKNGL